MVEPFSANTMMSKLLAESIAYDPAVITIGSTSINAIVSVPDTMMDFSEDFTQAGSAIQFTFPRSKIDELPKHNSIVVYQGDNFRIDSIQADSITVDLICSGKTGR